MGQTKQLVPWPTPTGSKPLIAAAYDAIRPICDEMVVVLGHEPDAVAAALAERSFQAAYSDADAAMFESIHAGIAAAQSIDPSARSVLQPGDHPEATSIPLTTLLNASLQRPDNAIIPEFQGRGGHPVLIPPAVAAVLVHAECPNGLGQYWLDHPDLVHRVPVDDASILRDVDTPGDLCI